MDALTFTAVCVVCATAIVVAWIAFDRWYVHKDRVEQQLTQRTEATWALLREQAQAWQADAEKRVSEKLALELAAFEDTRKTVQEHKATLREAALRGRL